jgi:hypothetical protein
VTHTGQNGWSSRTYSRICEEEEEEEETMKIEN